MKQRLSPAASTVIAIFAVAAFFVFSGNRRLAPVAVAAIVDTRKGKSVAEQFRDLPAEQRAKNFAKISEEEKLMLKTSWAFWSRPDQQLPPVEFQTWVIMAGRGFGKTRTGAETCREWALGPLVGGKRDQSKAYDIVNIIAPTADDARDICVEGESGILAICPRGERPEYLPSKRRLEWPNGARTLIFTADEPERLRGKQHKKLWCDELASWRYLREAWDQAQFGLRLGDNPQALVTTTPKPLKEIKELLAQSTTFLTRGTTYENRLNLAKAFYARVIAKYEGTRLGRQELHAELLEDNPNALFQRPWIDETRIDFETFWRLIHPKLIRIVGAIDPAVTSNEESDETGIVFAGTLPWEHVPPDLKKLCKFETDHYVVFDDRSDIYTPDGWAKKALAGYSELKADRLVGEGNNGGEMVEATLRHHDPNVSYTMVHASRGKVTRAEPISALYEQRRVHHVGNLGILEDQMCLVAGSLVETSVGLVPVESVKVGDFVVTRLGPCPVRWAGQTAEVSELVVVSYSDGCIIVTPCHPIFLNCQSKFVHAESVQVGQHLLVSRNWERMVGQLRGVVVGGVEPEAVTSDIRNSESYFTARFGKLIEDRSPQESFHTIKMRIQETICQEILSSLLRSSTARSMALLDGPRGTGSEGLLCGSRRGRKENQDLLPVSFAERSEKQSLSTLVYTAPVLAVERLRLKEPVPVFDLSVTAAREFFAEGILVHNCDYDPATCVDSPDRMDADVWALTELSESSTVLGVNEFFATPGGAEAVMTRLLAPPSVQPTVVTVPEFDGCPACQNLNVHLIAGGQKRCMECGHQFGGVTRVARGPMTRGEYLREHGGGR